jgi:hypothetical protein
VRILANENVPQPVVADLRRRGHDVAALESRVEWNGLFAIIEDDRIRTRPLPPT